MKKLLYLLLIPVYAAGQNSQTSLLDSFMSAQVAAKKFNGNVLVAKSGKIVYQKAFGFRNYATKETLDNNSLFELASLSKQFTAMGVLLLYEAGKLQLTDSLRKFFPELPYANVTIRQLLMHTSGLPDYEEAMNKKWDRKKIAFNKDVIEFLTKEKIPVEFSPGKQWNYSNTGYALLASVIEKVSGKTFAVFMHENIFSPLRMLRTRIYNTRRSSKEVIPNYAYGYLYSDSLKKYVLPDSIPEFDFVRYLDGIYGDGVINSTTGDLLKWDNALKNNTLLSKKTQQEMLSPLSPTDSTARVSYGYGVFVTKDKFGDKLFHSGGWPGYVTFFQRHPKEDLTIFVLSNNGFNSPSLSNQIAYLMHGDTVMFPYVHNLTAIDTSVLHKYIGIYRGADATVEVIKVNGRLYRKGNRNIELLPESVSKFFYGDETDRQIEFIVNKEGVVKTAMFLVDGIKTMRTKVE